MRFKVDENMHQDVAARLRQDGHDAVTVWDQSLQGTTDTNLAAVCQQEQRAIVTLDLDFADIRTYPPEQHHSIIVMHLPNHSREYVVRSIEHVLPMLKTEPLTGHLWIVGEHNVRIRGADTP